MRFYFHFLFCLTILVVLALGPWSCGGSTPVSGPVTIYYVPVTATPTLTPTPDSSWTPTPTITATLAIPHPYITQWGNAGTGPGEFLGPQGICVNSAGTTVWVVDSNNYRVQYFSGSGTYLGQWGSYGTADGQFYFPSAICANSTATTFYVTDSTKNNVQYFSPTGTYLGKWGTGGTGPGQLFGPRGIATDSAGTTVWVADSYYRVEYFSGTGSYLNQWGVTVGTTTGWPIGVAVNNAATTVIVTDATNDRIHFYGPTGIEYYLQGTSGSGNLQFEFPFLLGMDPSGNFLYVADSNNNRIQRLLSSGAYVDQIDGSSSGYPFNEPTGVAIDASNYLYVADNNNCRIVKFGP